MPRSFALSTTLPLDERQRALQQQDIALQELVQTGDTIRQDALALLDAADAERHLAAISLDVTLADAERRAAFVRAIVEAVRRAAEPFRAQDDATAGERFIAHVAIYPRPEQALWPAPT